MDLVALQFVILLFYNTKWYFGLGGLVLVLFAVSPLRHYCSSGLPKFLFYPPHFPFSLVRNRKLDLINQSGWNTLTCA